MPLIPPMALGADCIEDCDVLRSPGRGRRTPARGALRFVEELMPRVARAGATGPKLLRSDSGIWNQKIMARLQTAGWTYSIDVRQQKHIKAAITAIPEQDWQTLTDYPKGGKGRSRSRCSAISG